MYENDKNSTIVQVTKGDKDSRFTFDQFLRGNNAVLSLRKLEPIRMYLAEAD